MNKEKISLPKLFVRSKLCERKDPIIDKFYLDALQILRDQRQEFLKVIRKVDRKLDGKNMDIEAIHIIKDLIKKLQ